MARYYVKTESVPKPIRRSLVLTGPPCDTMKDASRGERTFLCSPSTSNEWPKATPHSRGVRPGKAEDESAPEREATDSRQTGGES